MNTPDDQPCGAGTQARALEEPMATGTDQHVLNDLAAGFAHELNQPLAAIAAYADGAATLLRRDPEHALQALGIVQAIAGQALRAGEVIQQLRDAARPQPQTGLPLDPNALLRTVLPLLQSLATQKDVGLVMELRTPVAAVHGDADRLQTMLVLLFSSALDTVTRLPADRRKVTIATDDGGCTVQVSATEPQGMLFQLHLPRADS
jgi:C4-dicarboxylate-specific signal transduction histidine kinase